MPSSGRESYVSVTLRAIGRMIPPDRAPVDGINDARMKSVKTSE